MIDPITIGRIQDAAQIVDVVSDFVTLKKRGVNYVGLCPFHEDRNPSFYVSPAKNICKCFSCNEGGAPVHFIMKHEQLSYYEALKYLAKKYNIEVVEKELTDEEKQAQSDRESMLILNSFANEYFIKTLHEHPEGKAIGLSYFRERGIRDDIIKKFQLGYSLEQRDALSVEAQKKGFKRNFLIKTGLSFGDDETRPLMDRFRGRVIFPIHGISGKVLAFGGRILKKADNIAKYVNSPESEVYSKSNELYGIYFAKGAIVKQNKCFLVEGYTDVISMHQAGIENVVASSGTALTHGQIRMIRRFSENITVLYDGDAAGIKAALRGIDLLLEDGMNVKVVLLPEGEDPDSFARKQNAESFNQYIADNEQDFIRFKTQLLLEDSGDDPIKRAELITNIVNSIALIPNAIIRQVYVQDCAQLLQVQEKMLIAEINKIRLRNYERKREQKADKKDQSEQQEVSQETTPTISIKRVDKNPFERFEYEIIRYIVRYGNTPLFYKYEKEKSVQDGKTVEKDVLVEVGPGVIEFVHFDLGRDKIDFTNDTYKQLFDEAVQNIDNEDFDSRRYFLSHPDTTISKLASELISDRYQLSKIHSKQLGEEVGDKDSRLLEENQLNTSVPRATTELKNAYIMQEIKKIQAELKKCDSGKALSLIEQLTELQEIKKALAKELGERIVLKF